MTPSKFLPLHSSFESIRKQAKKLARQFADADADALTRVHAQLPAPALPLSLRDAQLVLAREDGFAGWQDFRAAVLRLEGKGLEWAAAGCGICCTAERVLRRIRYTPNFVAARKTTADSASCQIEGSR